MFDWFDKTFRRREYTTDQRSDVEKIADDMSKVIPFPKGTGNDGDPPAPKEKFPEVKSISYYSVGITGDRRVSLRVGFSEINMNSQGVQELIDQLKLLKRQIEKL